MYQIPTTPRMIAYGGPPPGQRLSLGRYLRGPISDSRYRQRRRVPMMLGDWTTGLSSALITAMQTSMTAAQIDATTSATAQYQSQAFYDHITADVANDVKSLELGAAGSGAQQYNGVGPNASRCSSVHVNTGAIVAGAVGTSLLKISPATGPAAPFVAIAGGIVDLFSALFNPHQYPQQEGAILCGAVPAANQQLQAISSAVSSGSATPAQGSAALDTLLAQFSAAVNPIINHTAGNYAQTGDDAEFCLASLTAICTYLKGQFSAQATPAPAAAPGAVTAQTSAAGSAAGEVTTTGTVTSGLAAVPTWAWAAGLAALFLLLE